MAMIRVWWAIVVGAVVALLFLTVDPDIDLAVSRWFYSAGLGFPLEHLRLFNLVMKGLPVLVIGAAVLAGLLGIAGAFSHRVWLSITPRLAAYLVLSLALGPGLLVNTLLKDHWGRARPHQIVEFGGGAHFSPALLLSDQCARNCSFPSGHAALAFWLVAFASLVPGRWRTITVLIALTIGVLVGLMRIAQGGHFLSDVIAAAILVLGLNYTLKLLIVGPAHSDD
jgi:lipid A 4'-phosphatase